ncbi:MULTISPECIES: hypothetical protein [Bradyrhizobium]|uniref:Uncharacterized protein n=1 Tax=Bradyrhizobium xenonodulans TaxID=2736875 RepID=A0ABY7MHB1_9BRAD|nr:hypothetical protein [Bradyrhizobium xenonodulans]WBL77749.1 hypothetical protein I3J27_32810 [Bradyrhizobium xenonodulans]
MKQFSSIDEVMFSDLIQNVTDADFTTPQLLRIWATLRRPGQAIAGCS